MKLIAIHGPPAAGKHTVGKKLSELSGFKFFYNHLTVDVVRSLFEDEDKRRHDLLMNLRLEVIKTAALYDLNTVFTMAYTHDERSMKFVRNMRHAVEGHGGSVHFVRLDPPDATLYQRIGNESRRLLRKPTSPEHLRNYITKNDTRAIIDPAGLSLDTSKLSPEESAARIIEYFEL
ncbi:MAG TPA: AAA family ATPase [Candidatus Saccharimonadales bacterium]|nr:AAA family ATPase [Candidatus Saccharimonadales bacterium]